MTWGWNTDVCGISLDISWHMRSMEVMIWGVLWYINVYHSIYHKHSSGFYYYGYIFGSLRHGGPVSMPTRACRTECVMRRQEGPRLPPPNRRIVAGCSRDMQGWPFSAAQELESCAWNMYAKFRKQILPTTYSDAASLNRCNLFEAALVVRIGGVSWACCQEAVRQHTWSPGDCEMSQHVLLGSGRRRYIEK